MDRRTVLAGAFLGAATGMPAHAQKSGKSKTLSGGFVIHTNSERIGVTDKSAPMSRVGALVHVKTHSVSCAIRATSYWTGTTENPYQNNDSSLFEVFNKTESDSRNRSWAVSAANAYNDIPSGVTDTGERVAVLGWAVSVNHNGHTHSGTLSEQVGVWGRAGFQGGGDFTSPASARVQKAVSIRGATSSDSGTIGSAFAGEFVSEPGAGVIEKNFAIFARAQGGQQENWSFYGQSGKFYNGGKSFFGHIKSQSSTTIAARRSGNSLEFGHPDPAGYGSTIGATSSHGLPFVAFSAEADQSENTFTTRGKAGSVLCGDLAGGFIFGRIPDANAAGQDLVESVGINNRGNLRLSKNPPASATSTGEAGEMAWDDNFVYICIAQNTWKRSALSNW